MEFQHIGIELNYSPLLDKSFSAGSDGKESACNVEDPGSIPQRGRSPGEGNGYLLQHFCLENPMDRGACWARVHRVAESDMTKATACINTNIYMGPPGGSDGKESACNAGDPGSVPGLGRYPGEGNGYLLQ